MLVNGLLFLGAPVAWTPSRLPRTLLPLHWQSFPSLTRTAVIMSASHGSSGVGIAAADYAGVFAQSIGITKAWALPRDVGSETFMLQRTARDIDGNKLRSFVQSYELTDGKWGQASPFPLELRGVVIFSPSPSGKLLAIVREDSSNDNKGPQKESAYVIEIWGNEERGGCLLDQIPTAGSHGKIVGGTWFGGLSWAPDESKVVYVAQKKAVESRSFFAKAPAKPDDTASAPGDQFLYEEDWGEKYDGVSRLGLFVADLGGTGSVEEISGVSSALTPGQPRFSRDGKYVVYTAWECEPRKLGMIYCYQRPCNLYAAPVDEMLAAMDKETPKLDSDASETVATTSGEETRGGSEHKCLCPSWRLARSARFSPSGDRLVWLSREEGFDTHSGCFRLTSAPWDAESGGLAAAPRTLVDTVDAPETPAGFPGLWIDDLPDACWAPDGSAVYVTSAWGSRQSVIKIDAETSNVERVVAATAAARQDPANGEVNDVSASVLAVGSGGVYVAGSSPNSPGGFAVVATGQESGRAVLGPDVGGASITSTVRVNRSRLADLGGAVRGVQWRILSVPVEADTANHHPHFEAILLMPPSEVLQPSSVPLIVVPHGGPHGVMSTSFVPAYAFLCANQGMAVLHVNFRGSTGFGTTALESLPGRIGSQDVADVVAATQFALALEPEVLDPARVGVVGGSHGGFLGAHLTAQYPNIFKAAALRNPVTNIASMVTVSDIPDWCFIEALGRGKYEWDIFRPPTAEELRIMWDVSPIKHIGGVRAPTLVALGAKDRRVPQSQGLEWYHALKSARVEAKLLVYPEDVHAIDKPASEADQWLNIVSWLKTHLA